MHQYTKRPICILLAVIMIVSLFTILPVTTAGAVSNGSTAWVFSTNDGMTYNDLSDKYYRYNDTTVAFASNGSFAVSGNNVTLCGKIVATIDTTPEYIVKYADSVYVTGVGTETSPFVFYPNYIYGKDAAKVESGATIGIGAENSESTDSVTIEAIANPGDGFVGMAKLKTGDDNVQFVPYSTVQHATSKGKLLGVSKTNYGYNYRTSVATNAHKFTLAAKTLYYLGKNSSNTRLFSEYRCNKKSFTGGTGETYTVTWNNWDGTLLDSGAYCAGEIPSTGVTPTKPENAWYEYSFSGWGDVTAVSGDVTYTAQFTQVTKDSANIDVHAKIFPTNDSARYSGLLGKTFTYGGSTFSFTEDTGVFAEGNGVIYLCGQPVASYSDNKMKSNNQYAFFAHTVYVTGDGDTEPYIFTTNYIYGNQSSSIVFGDDTCYFYNLGTVTSNKDAATAIPGDGFIGLSKVRIGSANYVQFLPEAETFQCSGTAYCVGVGDNTYGTNYSGRIAKIKRTGDSTYHENHFAAGNSILYYYGEKSNSDSTVYMFSEYRPPYRSSFADSGSTAYTVIFQDTDGTVLDQNFYYYGTTPVYGGDTPTKAKDEDFIYTFSGWSPAISPVTENTIYTATYSTDPVLFKGYSLTLGGDIGVNFFLDVTDEEISTGSGVRVHFERTVNGTVIPDNFTIDPDNIVRNSEGYAKTTCKVPSAEMNYPISATVYINGVLQKNTDRQSVRGYADIILASPASFTPAGKTTESLVNLINTMLDYGAKSQECFGRTDVELANKDISYSMTPIDESDITAQKSDMRENNASFGVAYQGSTLLYLSQTSLRHYYKVTESSMLDSVKAAAADSGFEYGEKDGMIYFEKKNISAKDIDKVYPLSLGENGDYGFSVLDYCKIRLANVNAPIAEKYLAMATYWYNDAANTYFGS